MSTTFTPILLLASMAAPGQRAGPGNCSEPATHCQNRPTGASIGGNAADYTIRLADDFTPAVTGAITRLCVWGTYRSDTPFDLGFQVRYYLDDGANGSPEVPGTQIAEFTEAAGNLLVSPRVDTGQTMIIGADPPRPVFENVLMHAPITVSSSACYWLEIRNLGTVQWLWARRAPTDAEGNGRKAHDLNRSGTWDYGDATSRDMAWCMDLPVGRSSAPPHRPGPRPISPG